MIDNQRQSIKHDAHITIRFFLFMMLDITYSLLSKDPDPIQVQG